MAPFLLALFFPTILPLDPPRLQIEPPGEFDLGSLGPSERRGADYAIRNASAGPLGLRVLDLPSGMAAEGPALAAPIPGGGSARLRLVLDGEGREGLQLLDVRLGTDDPRQGRYRLPVRAFVRPDLSVDGTHRALGPFLAHESPAAVFAFRRESGGPVALRLLEEPPPHLEAAIDRGQGSARLTLAFRAGRVDPGARLGLDRLRVEADAGRPLELTVAWRFRHAVDAAPTRAVFTDRRARFLTLVLSGPGPGAPRVAWMQVAGGGFRVLPLPGGRIRVERRAHAPARALLRLGFREQGEALEIPLAYVPSSGPLRSGSPWPARGKGASSPPWRSSPRAAPRIPAAAPGASAPGSP